MCPGCRALVGAGHDVCAYCGWQLRLTRTHREGSLLERLVAPVGGAVGLIIGLNVLVAVAVALFQAAAAGERGPVNAFVDGVVGPDGRVLYAFGSGSIGALLRDGEWWRLFCSTFLHGGILHLGMNMWVLRDIGGAARDLYGAGKLLALYLLAGLAGAVASAGWQFVRAVAFGVPVAGSVGASGAVLGVVGLLIGVGWRVGGERGRQITRPLMKWVAIIFGIGFLLSFTGSPIQIDNAGHAGGFLAGLVGGRFTAFGIRSRGDLKAVARWDAVAVVLLLLYLAAFVPVALGLGALPG